MTYTDFRELRQSLQRDEPGLLDMAETNHVRALEPWLPHIEVPETAARAHRCHLAEDWLALFGLPDDWKSQVGVSRGVRHSLSLLLPALAQRGYHLRLPADVYPVYETLASEAHIERSSFPTLPSPLFPSVAGDQAEALLLTNPLKPLGRFLSDVEVQHLKAWLKEDQRRRLIVDAVYTFALRLHPTTLELFSTQQVIVLHSLSKGWASPQTMGVALFPVSDADVLRPIFRDNSPAQLELQKGQLLMRDYSQLPHRLNTVLEQKKAKAQDEMTTRGCQIDLSSCPGYLKTVEMSWEQLRRQFEVLAIPASVYGSSRDDLSVLSTLAVEISSGI